MALINADWWLYAIVAIGFAILMAINIYILVLWQHPDDKNEAFWPKTLVVLGLSLAMGTVLFLPLDVANNGGNVECNQSWSDAFCGALDMKLAWTVVMYLIFIFAFFLIPYTIFFYEEDDTAVLEGKFNFVKTFTIATKYMLAVCFILAIIVGLSYYYLGYSNVPVADYTIGLDSFISSNHTFPVTNQFGFSQPLGLDPKATNKRSRDIIRTVQSVRLNITFGLYLMALMSFIGWFLFAIFAGLGIPGIPIDMVRGFANRPQRLDRGQIAALELSIQRRCKELVEIGTLLKTERSDGKLTRSSYIAKKRRGQGEAKEFKRFKQMVYLLEEDYEQMTLCKDYSTKYNPLKPLGGLLFGMIALAIGALWIVHIIVYMLADPPLTLFLNAYFLWFDKFFPLFGAISVALFSMYLLLACLKGCFKFGLRLMWFTLHPMKINETYMNSFLFNVGMILMCTPAVVQFSVQAFDAYASSAEINSFFNVQVKYLRFFRYFYANDVFVYALLAVTFLSTIYLSYKPSDTAASTKEVRDALRKLDAKAKTYDEARAAKVASLKPEDD